MFPCMLLQRDRRSLFLATCQTSSHDRTRLAKLDMIPQDPLELELSRKTTPTRAPQPRNIDPKFNVAFYIVSHSISLITLHKVRKYENTISYVVPLLLRPQCQAATKDRIWGHCNQPCRHHTNPSSLAVDTKSIGEVDLFWTHLFGPR